MSNPLKHNLIRAVVAALAGANLPPKASPRLVVAVSGGIDSTVLLDVLCRISGFTLIVCHIDHRLRPDSPLDADFVKGLAENYNLPFRQFTAGDKPSGQNIEAWAREVRYKFLEQCRIENNADAIVTAHHQDDLAETLLIKTISGRLATSANILAAHDPVRHLVRPFIEISREEINNYARAAGVSHREDSTNACHQRTRNRIRGELIPLLATKYNANIAQCLATTAKRLAEDEAVLNLEAQRHFNQSTELNQLPPALRWRVARAMAIHQLGPIADGLGLRAFVEAARLVVEKKYHQAPIDLGLGIRCYARHGEGLVYLYGPEDPESTFELPLNVPGETQLALGHNIQLKIMSELRDRLHSDPEKSNLVASFDADALKLSNLVLRARAKGDWVRVWKRGRRSVKKLLNEKHIPLVLRRNFPLVTSEEQVLWVPGVARSELAPVTGQTRKVLIIKIDGLRSHST